MTKLNSIFYLLLFQLFIGCDKDDSNNSNFSGQIEEDLLLKEWWIDGVLKNSYDYYEDLRPKTQTHYDEFGEVAALFQYYYLGDTIYWYRHSILSNDSGLVGKWYPILDNVVREECYYFSTGLYKYLLISNSIEGCGPLVSQTFELDPVFTSVDSITYDGPNCSGVKIRYADGYYFDKTVWLTEEGSHFYKSMEIPLFNYINKSNITESQIFNENDELLYWTDRTNTYNSSNYPTSIYEIDSDGSESLQEFTYY